MAKAPKKYYIHLNLERELSISDSLREKFLSDSTRGEMAIDLTIHIDTAITYGLSLYANHFTSGALTLIGLNADKCKLTCQGVAERDLDPNFDSDLIAALTNGDLVASVSSITDSDVNDISLEGSSQTPRCICSLNQTLATSVGI
jgi:hypothetical protein